MAVLVALLGLTFFVSRGCQHSQIVVSQDDAIAAATARVNFKPDDSIVRLLRQGLSAKPFWVVVLYQRKGGDLVPHAQVYVDAKSGEVTKVTETRAAQNGGGAKARDGAGGHAVGGGAAVQPRP